MSNRRASQLTRLVSGGTRLVSCETARLHRPWPCYLPKELLKTKDTPAHNDAKLPALVMYAPERATTTRPVTKFSSTPVHPCSIHFKSATPGGIRCTRGTPSGHLLRKRHAAFGSTRTSVVPNSVLFTQKRYLLFAFSRIGRSNPFCTTAGTVARIFVKVPRLSTLWKLERCGTGCAATQDAIYSDSCSRRRCLRHWVAPAASSHDVVRGGTRWFWLPPTHRRFEKGGALERQRSCRVGGVGFSGMLVYV